MVRPHNSGQRLAQDLSTPPGEVELKATSHLFVAKRSGEETSVSDIMNPLAFPCGKPSPIYFPYDLTLQPNQRAWKIPGLLERTSYRDFQRPARDVHDRTGLGAGVQVQQKPHKPLTRPQISACPKPKPSLWSPASHTVGSNPILPVP